MHKWRTHPLRVKDGTEFPHTTQIWGIPHLRIFHCQNNTKHAYLITYIFVWIAFSSFALLWCIWNIHKMSPPVTQIIPPIDLSRWTCYLLRIQFMWLGILFCTKWYDPPFAHSSLLYFSILTHHAKWLCAWFVFVTYIYICYKCLVIFWQ